jgi:Mg-chelatase subunit ChlD
VTRFADPLWFALAALVIARVVLLVRDRRGRVGAFGFSSLSLVASARGIRARTSGIPFVLETLALLLLIAALARPQRVVRLAATDRYGIDIVVALDASGSMAAEDFRPRNRFTVAKELIGEFIRGRTDDRIGLVTFGSRAATRVPVTYDRRITEGILDRSQLGEHGNGTAIGHALATSVNRLRTSRTRSRVIILVTDGVNNSGSIEPRVAAQRHQGLHDRRRQRRSRAVADPAAESVHRRDRDGLHPHPRRARRADAESNRRSHRRRVLSRNRRRSARARARSHQRAGEDAHDVAEARADRRAVRLPAGRGAGAARPRSARGGDAVDEGAGMSFRAILLLWLLAAIPFALAFLVSRERLRTRIARRFAAERLRGTTNPARSLRPWRNSMAAEDVGTSRLSAAKAIAMRLADAQEGRVALVVFEATPEVVSPLTSDTASVASLVDTILPGEIGEPGSDVGSAILAALRLIEHDPEQKVDLVVLSDGEDQGTRVTEAVQRARAKGVQISTIVVGSPTGSTIPSPRGPLRDDSGEVVTTYARTDVMSEIARGTGGVMLENPFGADALDPLLGKQGTLSKNTSEMRMPVDRYQWPLGLAMLLFLAGSVLNRGAE